jgi:DHA2 family multidrug resistance protein
MTSATQPVSASGRALHAMRANSQRLRIDSWRPYVGIVGVLLGAIMSTLGTRVTTLGLADLRGGLHVGLPAVAANGSSRKSTTSTWPPRNR